jgi:hypothetical protein
MKKLILVYKKPGCAQTLAIWDTTTHLEMFSLEVSGLKLSKAVYTLITLVESGGGI